MSRKITVKAKQVTGALALSSLRDKVNKAIQEDPRFDTDKHGQPEGSIGDLEPWCVDVIWDNGDLSAVICTDDSRLVKAPFTVNESGEVSIGEGEPELTEATTVYSHEIEQHATIKASDKSGLIHCRAAAGVEIPTSSPWEAGKPISFIYAPAGLSTITAGFRANESITITVEVDEDTAKTLQASFDSIVASEKQEPFADEDHESRKATMRFPKSVQFTWGTVNGENGIVVQGAEPTSYGADVVNGKVYRSWSPEFATDADYSKATQKKGHWTFPEGVRGSASNPARLIGVGFVTGALTNKPAFRNMPPVKAKKVEPEENDAPEITADNIHFGAMAHKEFREGMNPPSFVKDEAKWHDAKEAALKTYKLGDDAFWPAVMSIYEKMGGETHKAKASEAKVEETIKAEAKPEPEPKPSPLEVIYSKIREQKTVTTTGKLTVQEIYARMGAKKATPQP